MSEFLSVPEETDVLDAEEIGPAVHIVCHKPGVFTGYHVK